MKKFKYVNKVGVEFEGNWSYSARSRALENNGAWHDDGSVSGDGEYVGEIVCHRPILPEEVKTWIDNCYPDEGVNETCGMHVHVSFKRLKYYATLMEPHFFAYLKSRFDSWGRAKNIRRSGHGKAFWDRLSGQNDFCNDHFTPETQFLHKGKNNDRYTMLNYTWARYSTIECRLLPMFKSKEICESAIFELLRIYEDYLRIFKPDKLVAQSALTEADILFEKDIPDHDELSILVEVG